MKILHSDAFCIWSAFYINICIGPCKIRKAIEQNRLVLTGLYHHLLGYIRWHATCTLKPRRQCRNSSIPSTTSNRSLVPGIPSAVDSFLMSSEGEVSPDPTRSLPSHWNRIRLCSRSTSCSSWTRWPSHDAWTWSSLRWKSLELILEWESSEWWCRTPLHNLTFYSYNVKNRTICWYFRDKCEMRRAQSIPI